MIAAGRVAVVLLAAGRSLRFGAEDKLARPLDGLALGLHAARTLAAFPFAARIAVVGTAPPDYATFGFTHVVNADPAAGQSRSIALGVAAARAHDPDAILIALADMPFVPGAHIAALLARFGREEAMVASADGDVPCPPALFDRRHFDALAGLSGDRGAGALLGGALLVPGDAAILRDIDTLEEWAAAGGG